MALQIFGGNSIGYGVRADLGANDDVFVANTANVGSLDDVAIKGTGSGQTAIIQGTATGWLGAVALGDNATIDHGGAKAEASACKAWPARALPRTSSMTERSRARARPSSTS